MLYSVLVKFRTQEKISFNYYTGESLHGMFFNLLSEQDKAKADKLHGDYEVKPFTISPILPYPRRKGKKQYLNPNKKYFFRITFLEDKWYHLFMEYFLYQQAELQLQGGRIKIDKVLTQSEEDNRCNSLEYEELIGQAEQEKKIKFKFHSTTSFRVGDRHVIFPAPRYLFYSLHRKWEQFGPVELALESDDFNEVYLSRYDLHSIMEQFNGYSIKGFKGYCWCEANNDLPDEKIKELNLLADFAFYSGVGYKTTMGLGQTARQN